MIRLHFNESPFDLKKDILREFHSRLEKTDLNRYGSFRGERLIEKLASHYSMSPNNIAVGNGSDELLKLVTEVFLKKGEKALTISPHFVVYPEYVDLVGGEFIQFYLDDNLSIDEESFIEVINKEKPALIYLCTPHNPTGMTLRKEFIDRVIDAAPHKVVVDEAYIEFSDAVSYIEESAVNSKVIVARTFSKAFGIAGVRLGYITSTSHNIELINSRRLIFSLSSLSEVMGEVMLDNSSHKEKLVDQILVERKRVLDSLSSPNITVYPSEGSFIFMRSSTNLYKYLKKNDILISKVPWKDDTTYRVTIGTVEENNKLIHLLNSL